jgi:hypothetical protein
VRGIKIVIGLIGALGATTVWAEDRAGGNSPAIALFTKANNIGSGSSKACPPKFGRNSANSVPLVIEGEHDHDDAAVLEKRKELFEQAGRGEIFIGFEGYVMDDPQNSEFFKQMYGCNPKTSHANGLDEPFINSTLERFGDHLRMTWALTNAPGLSDGKPDLHKLEMLYEISDNPVTLDTWNNMDKDGLDPEMVKFIGEFILLKGNDAAQTRKLETLKANQQLWTNNPAFLRVSKRLAYGVVATAEMDENRLKYKVPNMEIVRDLIKNPTNQEIQSAFLKDVDIAWRRAGFTKNAQTLYERAKAAGKPLHLIVGTSHVRDDLNGKSFVSHLKDMGYSVAVNVN